MFSGREHEGGSIRFLCRALLLLAILAPLQAAAAQQAVAISPSVVLVLKLVSKTLVKPTTGIVVSDDGIVAVPAEFAAEAGEMIVLDGGADILSNGRPATIIDASGAGELAFLRVKGLTRPGIRRSASALEADAALHMEAFPPAEDIAKGAQPLKVPVKVLHGGHSISAETPLPYVTGAILDACGHLAGVSLANGTQSLESARPATLLFGDDLGRSLDAMRIELPVAVCQAAAPAAAKTATAKNPVAKPAVTQNALESAVETAKESSAEPATATPQNEPPVIPAQDVVVAPPLRETANETREAPSVWQNVPAWLPVLGLFVLGVLLWKVVFFFRLQRKAPEQAASGDAAQRIQAASDEPVTAPLANSADAGAVKPRSAPVPDLEVPLGVRPDNCDGALLVEGFLDAETPFRRLCFVDTVSVDVVIGRGDADIVIEHEAVSRSHARIISAGGLLTLSDLGSRNGTFIGDLPCLPGEIFYIGEDDEIYMGDVRMTIRTVRQEAQWA